MTGRGSADVNAIAHATLAERAARCRADASGPAVLASTVASPNPVATAEDRQP